MINDIPEAGTDGADSGDETQQAFSQIPPLVIGVPFAMSEGLELVDEQPDVHPGCVAIVRCEGTEAAPCRQIFKIPLLVEGYKTCPKCRRSYTHVLLIAPHDDDDIVADAMEVVLKANGFPVPGSDDDEDDDE